MPSNIVQELLDGPDEIIDLNGETHTSPGLTISTKHNRKTLTNGAIRFERDPARPPHYAWVEIQQGKNGFPPGLIDFNFGDPLHRLDLDAGFDFFEPLQALNEYVAKQQGHALNIITTVSTGAEALSFENVHLRNCGRSGIAVNAKRLRVKNCSGEQIAKHLIGSTGGGNRETQIDGLRSHRCGNILDLSNPDKDFFDVARPDVARLRDLFATDSAGRAKQASRNWDIELRNFASIQSSPANPNFYGAWSQTYNARRTIIDGFYSRNFPNYGLQLVPDAAKADGILEIRNATVENSLSGFFVGQRATISRSIFKTWQRYRTGAGAVESELIDAPTYSAAEWCDIFGAIRDQIEALNSKYGTTYATTISPLPKPIAPTP